MRIADTNFNSISLGSDSNRDTIGIVFKTSAELNNRPLLGLIIPKFMIGYDFRNGDKPSDTDLKISGSKCINDESCKKFWDTDINIKNYILVRPYLNQNISMPLYTVGDKVIVTVIDNDIKTLAFLPYSINRLGQRATDKFMASVPANPKENTSLTENNTYFIKLDSKAKVLILSTSKENGETAAQTIGMDPGNGQIAITDNDKLVWMMDTNQDAITSKTSGTTIEQKSNAITMTGDIINLNGESQVNIKTDAMNVDSNTIKSKATDAKYEYDSFTQTSQIGKWEVDTEEHSNMAMAVKASTYHNDTPIIGLNGNTIFPSFTIGAVPNINVPVAPTAGLSGPQGSMLMQTDPGAVPLVKFPQLVPILRAIASAADSYPSGGGSASAAVAQLANAATTKMMSS